MNTYLIPNFTGKRWLKITLRSFHILGVAGVFGGVLFDQPVAIFWALAMSTGVGLLLLESLSNFIWFVQVRALVSYFKLILLTIFYFYPETGIYCLSAMIIMSGVISHASSSIRYYSFIHGKKVQSVRDIKG